MNAERIMKKFQKKLFFDSIVGTKKAKKNFCLLLGFHGAGINIVFHNSMIFLPSWNL